MMDTADCNDADCAVQVGAVLPITTSSIIPPPDVTSAAKQLDHQSSSISVSTSTSVVRSSARPRATTDFTATTTTTTSSCPPRDEIDQSLPWWYPRFRGRPAFYGNQEALGWALTATASGILIVSIGAFFAPALLVLAKKEAGCATEPPPGESVIPECNATVYGLRPSSLITTFAAIMGVIVAVFLPVLGAVVDYTPHRKAIGKWATIAYGILIIPLIFLSEDTWFPLALLLLVMGSINFIISLTLHAYLPELTDNEERMIYFTRTFTVLPFSAMVITIVTVMGLSIILNMPEDLDRARISLVITVVFVNLFFNTAWGCGNLMKPRPAAHVLPEGKSVLTAGFRQIYHSSIKIYRNYRPTMYFLLAIANGEAAVQALTSIALTFMADFLQFSSVEVGLAGLGALLFSIPGAFFSAWCSSRFNPIRSSMGSVFLLLLSTVAMAFSVRGPDQKVLCVAIMALMGVGAGWKQSSDRMVISQLIPRGQEAEFMGIYLFSNQIISWLPPLIFTVMNEAGVPQQVGLCSVNIFFVFGLCAYLMMGDFHDAVAIVRPVGRSTDKDNGSGALEIPDVTKDNNNHLSKEAASIDEDLANTSVGSKTTPLANITSLYTGVGGEVVEVERSGGSTTG